MPLLFFVIDSKAGAGEVKTKGNFLIRNGRHHSRQDTSFQVGPAYSNGMIYQFQTQ